METTWAEYAPTNAENNRTELESIRSEVQRMAQSADYHVRELDERKDLPHTQDAILVQMVLRLCSAFKKEYEKFIPKLESVHQKLEADPENFFPIIDLKRDYHNHIERMHKILNALDEIKIIPYYENDDL